ncbi:MAG: enoyl-CoA hydratase/isomerase family protein [Lysobacterales bacterium]|jgi:enoyl-CoA hydratase/carnithine racemase
MLEIHNHGSVREIQMARPRANAMNNEMVNALNTELKSAAKEADAVVLSGLPGMFSAGLDVPELLDFERPAFTDFWHRFIDVQRTIATLPVPIAFAMTGHAPAGGILLGVLGDYRIMPRGPFKTGLNEVHIGLVVPEPPFEALVHLVGSHAADRIISEGRLMLAEEAEKIGLVDELADSVEAVVPRAIEWCEERLALPRDAMLQTREMARRYLHEFFDGYDEARGDNFIDIWFSEGTQRSLRGLVEKLKK